MIPVILRQCNKGQLCLKSIRKVVENEAVSNIFKTEAAYPLP